MFLSLKCCLDLWLSSMFDWIHNYVFLFLKNCFWAISTASRNLSTARLSIEPLDFPFSTVVIAISIHRSFWEFVSIASRSIEKVSRCSIAFRSIEVSLLWTPLDSSSIAPSVENLNLDTSCYLLIHWDLYFYIKPQCVFSLIFSNLSWQFLTLHLPKHFSLSLDLLPKCFLA